MRNYHPKADKRRREAVERIVKDWDDTNLADAVRDRLQYGDGPVIRIASTMEHAYTLSEDDGEVRSEDTESECFGAAESLRDALRAEVEAQVQETLEDLAESGRPVADAAAAKLEESSPPVSEVNPGP